MVLKPFKNSQKEKSCVYKVCKEIQEKKKVNRKVFKAQQKGSQKAIQNCPPPPPPQKQKRSTYKTNAYKTPNILSWHSVCIRYYSSSSPWHNTNGRVAVMWPDRLILVNNDDALCRNTTLLLAPVCYWSYRLDLQAAHACNSCVNEGLLKQSVTDYSTS